MISSTSFIPVCAGGDWYACTTAYQFVGCCRSFPCGQDSGCPGNDLEPAFFNTTYYHKFPDQNCSFGSAWYTCTGSETGFMGCCKTDACKFGCNGDNVTAGFLSLNSQAAAAFEPDEEGGSGQILATGLSSLAASTVTEFHTPKAGASTGGSTTTVAPALPIPKNPDNSSQIGTIVGGVLGGAAALVLLIALLLLHYRRHTKRSRDLQQRSVPATTDDAGTGPSNQKQPDKSHICEF